MVTVTSNLVDAGMNEDGRQLVDEVFNVVFVTKGGRRFHHFFQSTDPEKVERLSFYMDSSTLGDQGIEYFEESEYWFEGYAVYGSAAWDQGMEDSLMAFD